MPSRSIAVLLSLALAAMTPPAFASPPGKLVSEAMDMLDKGIAFETAKGNGETLAFAKYLAGKLKSAGFDKSAINIIPVNDTAALTVRYSGTTDAKPILILGHMDVVPAQSSKDWVTDDPFHLTKKNGYLYGRGVADMKTEDIAVVKTFMRLKREGFEPQRGMILLLTGDEETTGASAQMLAKQFSNAAYAINAEGGVSMLDAEGNPIIFGVQSAEKEYGDFKLTVKSAGGHSSEPDPSANAIYHLSKALARVTEFEFPVRHNKITRGWLRTLGEHRSGLLAAAMQEFAAHPDNNVAASVITKHPAFIGQIRTTCIPTVLDAGQAPNALPQLATATINCRIWPEVTGEKIKSTLVDVINDPTVKVTYARKPQVAPSSPVDPDIMQAITNTVHERYPNVDVTPMMVAAATDSAYYRAAGIRSYGINPIYAKPGERNMHGINEKIIASEVPATLDFWYSLLPRLTQ